MKDKKNTHLQDHYKKRIKKILTEAHNLVLIVADEHGKINWNGANITPYIFVETFLQGNVGFPEKVDYPNLVVDEEISKNILNEGFEEMYDPIKQIEIRKKGLLVSSPINFEGLKYFRNTELGIGGYLFYVQSPHLESLAKARIEHCLLEF